MSAYVIADVKLRPDADMAAYGRYRGEVEGTLQPFGGRFVVRGGAHEVVEGGWNPSRLVAIEFPDLASAHRWYGSDAYQAIVPLRTGNADTDVVFVEGV